MASKPSINNIATGRKDSIFKIRLGLNTQEVKKMLHLLFSKQTTQPTFGAGQAALICSQTKKRRAPREKSEQEVPCVKLVLSIQGPPNRSAPQALSHIPEES